MRKIILFMHVSLDGYVAGPNGEIDWILVDNELFDFAGSMTDQADAAIYGRITYEMMDNYWPTAADKPQASKHDIEHSRWYNQVSKYVLSRTMKNSSSPNTKILNHDFPAEIAAIKQQPGKNILIFGSPGASQALADHGLIDEYWLFINPIVLGQGIPLFAKKTGRIHLKREKALSFSNGVVSLHYSRT